MEIDKSKLSPEEVAQLEAIEKKAGIPAQAAPATPAGVEKSAPATPKDAPVARDLLETLTAHADGCVGMAANMIGVLKRIIAVEAEDGYLVLFYPVILKKSGQYEAEEGCLSLEGVRKTKRWQSIKVQYQTMDGKLRIKTFTGWTAQIIQHEIDHCDGILI